jgi:hypothetical protein
MGLRPTKGWQAKTSGAGASACQLRGQQLVFNGPAIGAAEAL